MTVEITKRIGEIVEDALKQVGEIVLWYEYRGKKYLVDGDEYEANELTENCYSILTSFSYVVLKSEDRRTKAFIYLQGEAIKDEVHGLLEALKDLNGYKKENSNSDKEYTEYDRIIEKIFQQIGRLRLTNYTFLHSFDEELVKVTYEVMEREESTRKIQERTIAKAVAMAFKVRLDSARKWRFWIWPLVGAVLFFATAGFVTYYFFIHNMELEEISLAQSLPRLAFTSILVSPGVFCLRQYIRHRNILDDYNYKTAVAESIDPTLAVLDDARDKGIYLKAAFGAIHQHPLAKNHEPHTSVRRLLNLLQSSDPTNRE